MIADVVHMVCQFFALGAAIELFAYLARKGQP